MILNKKKSEEILEDVQFNIFKFTDKPKPNDPKEIVILFCFSEFGCEVIGSMYCIPRIIKENPDKYYIVVGWYGRDYLYKHLVDEFWEIKEEYQWLRDYALAFHNNSRNLNRIGKYFSKFGKLIGSDYFGKICVANECQDCKHYWYQNENVDLCPLCKKTDITKSLFADINNYKKNAVKIPDPSLQKMEYVKQYLGKNPVAIIARNRKTYGRNLQIEFYEKLIYLLENMGYNPIWVGEKINTYPCPVDRIIDFSRMEESKDLEITLAIIKQCLFTVQFWTASTRLAAIMGVPYLLFESPDQLFGNGQEAYRLGLCTFGNKKIVLSHFLNVLEDNDTSLKLIERSVNEMRLNKWDDIIGMVDEPAVVASMRTANLSRLGELN